jgi:hypothetical protein
MNPAGLETTPSSLPPHGRIQCRRCFPGVAGDTLEAGKWQAVNDPGAWGSSTPEVLVLGFSKGFTQANAYRSDIFENIPFKNMRPRLEASLKLLNLMDRSKAIASTFTAQETRLAYGSLVRCSLSRLNDRTGNRECTGQVMPKAFTESVSPMVRRCAETFLSRLPDTVRVVVMLGTTDAYVRSCRDLIRSIYGSSFSDVNAVAYKTGKALWVHVAHPSGMNGFYAPWLEGNPSNPSGLKCSLAKQAVASHMALGIAGRQAAAA